MEDVLIAGDKMTSIILTLLIISFIIFLYVMENHILRIENNLNECAERLKYLKYISETLNSERLNQYVIQKQIAEALTKIADKISTIPNKLL